MQAARRAAPTLWGSGAGPPARPAGPGRLMSAVSSFAAPPPKRRRLDGAGQHSRGLAATASSSSSDDDDEQPPPGALASGSADPVPRAAAAAAAAGARDQHPAAAYRSALAVQGDATGGESGGGGSAGGSGAAALPLTLAATAVAVSSRGGALDLRLCPGCSAPFNIACTRAAADSRHILDDPGLELDEATKTKFEQELQVLKDAAAAVDKQQQQQPVSEFDPGVIAAAVQAAAEREKQWPKWLALQQMLPGLSGLHEGASDEIEELRRRIDEQAKENQELRALLLLAQSESAGAASAVTDEGIPPRSAEGPHL